VERRSKYVLYTQQKLSTDTMNIEEVKDFQTAIFYGKVTPVDTGFTLSPIVLHPAQYKELYTYTISAQIRLSDS